MSDDADHVVEAIDNALRDWSVSGDAMRHAPDAPRVKVPPVPRVPVPNIRTDLLCDLVLFGNAYVDEATGRRIDPLSVVRRGPSVHDSGGAIDIARSIRAIPPLPSVGRIHEAMQQMARDMVPAMQGFAATMRRFEDAARAAGVIPEAPPADLDPRERALRARRNRNTGPARDPFIHRGNR